MYKSFVVALLAVSQVEAFKLNTQMLAEVCATCPNSGESTTQDNDTGLAQILSLQQRIEQRLAQRDATMVEEILAEIMDIQLDSKAMMRL